VNVGPPAGLSPLAVLGVFVSVFLFPANAEAQALPQTARTPVYCTGEGPECVLECIVRAQRTRDVALYDALIAEDFYYFHGSGDARWGREEELAAFRASVGDSIRTWDIDFPFVWAVGSGGSQQTWRISNVDMVITMDPKDDSLPVKKFAKKGVEFYVREIEKPDRHFVIFCVREPEGAISEIGADD
jgi:hypothetical protein